MDGTTSERAPRVDAGEAIATTIRDHRWPAYIFAVELVLGLLAGTLQVLAPSGTENHQYEVLAGMIGGWMVVILAVAVVVFLIMTALNALDSADDHYLDYLESSK